MGVVGIDPHRDDGASIPAASCSLAHSGSRLLRWAEDDPLGLLSAPINLLRQIDRYYEPRSRCTDPMELRMG